MMTMKNYSAGVRLQVIGGLAVLFSFVAQQAAYEFWSEKDKTHQAAQMAYFATHITSLSYQNLFFSSGAVTNVQNGELLKKAAEQDVHGRVIMLLAEADANGTSTKLIGEAQHRIETVHDLDSYNRFVHWLNGVHLHSPDSTAAFLSQTRAGTTLWKAVFVGLFILGSMLALVGAYIEKRAAKSGA